MATEKEKLFSEEYTKLKNIESKIDKMEEKDIDELKDLIDQATISANFCKERIDSISKSLEIE